MGQGLRHGVGHLHEGGNAAGDGCPGFRGDFRFVGEAGFAEMDLVVDQAGQQVEPADSRAPVLLGRAAGGDGGVSMLPVKVSAHGQDAVATGEEVARFRCGLRARGWRQ